MVICRISRTDAPVTERRILVPRQGSECRMFTAEQYREKAALVRSPARHSDRVRNHMRRIRDRADIRTSGPLIRHLPDGHRRITYLYFRGAYMTNVAIKHARCETRDRRDEADRSQGNQCKAGQVPRAGFFRAQGQGRLRDLSWQSSALIMKPEVVFGTVSAFPFSRQIRPVTEA
jgi:hypothetical protein